MSGEASKFMEDLEEIKISHPNIYAVWHTYVGKRISNLEKALEKGRTMLLRSQTISDVPKEGILLLLAFSE